MNILYEEFRDGIEALDVRRNEKYVYPPHFHRNIEILISLEGSRSVVHNGVPYHVGNGDIFFCGSYDLHSYGADTEGKKNDCLVIVPAARTARFNERNRGLKPASPLIHDETLCARLLEIADRFMADKNQSESVRGAACELLLALIGERLDFVQGKERDETQLIRAVLSYLSEHFRRRISSRNRAEIRLCAGARLPRFSSLYEYGLAPLCKSSAPELYRDKTTERSEREPYGSYFRRRL